VNSIPTPPLPKLVSVACLLLSSAAHSLETPSQSTAPGPPLQIDLAAGEIEIDGQLDDDGWSNAQPVTTWFETRPGDNLEPQRENIGYLAYDERFFYAAFRFIDPEPERIRAPLSNRDNVPSYTDYGGVIIDSNDDGRTAQMFLANARGIQYDALQSDASGEDSAPDFFWESAAQITEEGWTLEMRIPFSSLRYTESDPEQWRILLYRNYPREFRYQFFSSRLPRDSNCFICNSAPLTGLSDLPSGSHWVVAPYVTGSQAAEPEGDLGTSLRTDDPASEIGLDAKWLPNPNTILDLTVNPDFSQIESDAPLISANERFALFFPEKRPFFLESSDLLDTPLTAMYTRSFTAPRWGTRATGEYKGTTYTMLVGEDRGGGSTIIPGSQGSDLAEQDFSSIVAMSRVRRDFGSSFVSFVYTGREIDGGAYNRVFGPDFRWEPTSHDVISGQLLFSESETPDRDDLADEWDGRSLSGHGAELWWSRQLEHWDFFTLYNDLSEEFRADNGFIPQVGIRRGFGEIGRTLRPKDKPITRIRLFTAGNYRVDRDGRVIDRWIQPGFGFDGLLNSFVRFEFFIDETRAGDRLIRRNLIRPRVNFTPGGIFSEVTIRGTFGEDIDFANDRPGDTTSFGITATLQPTDHLQVALRADERALDVSTADGRSGRLFTADIARVRATYTFNSKSWLRVIGEWIRTERRADLYDDPSEIEALSKNFGGSVVFAYKLNWQSVLFLGYGDNRELAEFGNLEPSGREAFIKISYALQH